MHISVCSIVDDAKFDYLSKVTAPGWVGGRRWLGRCEVPG